MGETDMYTGKCAYLETSPAAEAEHLLMKPWWNPLILPRFVITFLHGRDRYVYREMSISRDVSSRTNRASPD